MGGLPDNIRIVDDVAARDRWEASGCAERPDAAPEPDPNPHRHCEESEQRDVDQQQPGLDGRERSPKGDGLYHPLCEGCDDDAGPN